MPCTERLEKGTAMDTLINAIDELHPNDFLSWTLKTFTQRLGHPTNDVVHVSVFPGQRVVISSQDHRASTA